MGCFSLALEEAAVKTFDYIIVGAGSAGCVLANRLTASGHHRVLLLEAGGHDRNIWIHIPLGYGKLFANAKVNWLYSQRAGARARQPPDHPAARQGAGRIELDQRPALCARPARGFRPLAAARQCRLGLRRRAAVFPPRRGPGARRRRRCTACGGPLAVSDVSEPHPLCEAFIEAAEQAGLPAQRRFQRAERRKAPAISSSPRRTAGAGRPRSAICGRRGGGRNLEIATDALATRLCFRRPARRRRRISAGRRDAHARMPTREVIVAGGAFNSPQLLQLSGIGPAELLRSHGIDVVADMPGVGADLQDHLQIRMQYRCTEPITMNDVINNCRHRYGRRPALPAVAQRPADDRRRLCRRLFAHAAGTGDARCADPFPHLQRRYRRRRAASSFPAS